MGERGQAKLVVVSQSLLRDSVQGPRVFHSREAQERRAVTSACEAHAAKRYQPP